MSDESAREVSHWTRQIDSALLVLLLTAASYAVAFAYEAGYLSHFGIPMEFSEVSLRDLLLCGVALVSAFFGIFLVLELPFRALPSKWPPVVRFRVGLDLALLILAFILLSRWGGVSRFAWIVGLGFPAVMLAGELL